MRKGQTSIQSINYSFVPNHQETMEALARTALTGRQIRLIILIMNQTDGYLREEDHLGPKFLVEKTGITKEHCYHVLADLKAMNIVASPGPGIFKVNPPKLWKKTGAADGTTAAHGTSLVPPMAPTGAAHGTKMNDSKDNLLKTTTKDNLEGVNPSTPGTTERKAEGDPRVQETALALEKERGYRSPLWAAEAKAIKWMLGQSRSPEDILACWRAMKRDPWWASRELLLMSVQKEIGQWVSGGKKEDAFERRTNGAVRRYSEKRGSQQYTPDDQA